MTDKDKEQENNPFSEEKIQENVEQVKEEDTQEENKEEQPQEEEQEEDNKLEKEHEELKGQYVRLAADFDNYRKRQAQEREGLLKYGAENTLKMLLPVIDTLDRAQKSIDEMDDCKQLKESIDVINKQLRDALEKAGLKKIETEGKEFDPNLHEAVMQTPTSEHPDHTVMQEMQSGYMMDDRVLRAALVNVAVSE